MKIVFEDDGLLVIDKPYGVVVNRSQTTKEETVQDWVESINPISNFQFPVNNDQLTQEFISRSGIVHRLDKDTSGLLVIAKTPGSFEKLKNQFKNREVTKKYLALVHGQIYPLVGKIDAPIERNPFNRMHYGIFPGGREALTEYRVNKVFKEYCLLEVFPKTGRTHQIRVHMKYLNHPIISDPIYGGRKQYKKDLEICPRLFLHATYLKINGQEFNSPLPADLQTVLDTLQ
ncbi:RNA pseudouridine synthase [Candidatus Microgenomates bacterium]|nr:RNA pseudouridine synthase [Candidatus Microgenomates bacterium]